MNNEFLFSLKADLTQFQRAMQQAAQVAGKATATINAQINNTSGSFGNLGRSVKSSQVILDQYGNTLVQVGQSAKKAAAETAASLNNINQRVTLLRNSMYLLNNQISAAGGFRAFAQNANMSLTEVISMYKEMQAAAQQYGIFANNMLRNQRTAFDSLYGTISRQVKLFATWTLVIGTTMAAIQGLRRAYTEMIQKSSEFQVQGVLFNAYKQASANEGQPISATTGDLLRQSITLASRWGDEVNDVAQNLSLWTKRTGDWNAAQYMANQTLKFQLATGTQIEDQYRALTALSTQAPDIFGLDKTSKTLQMVTAAAVTAGAGMHQLDKMGDEMGSHLNNSAVILLEAMEKDAAALKSLGYGAKDIIALNQALIQAFGNVGSGAQEAAEKIGRLAGGIARLGKPSSITALQKAGIDLSGLTSQKDVLAQLAEKWGKLNKAQQDNLAVSLAGNRQYEALEAILGALSEKDRILTAMKKNMNAEDTLALAMQGTYEVALKKVNAQWEGFVIAVGQGALPILSQFISFVANSVIPQLSIMVLKLEQVGSALAAFAHGGAELMTGNVFGAVTGDISALKNLSNNTALINKYLGSPAARNQTAKYMSGQSTMPLELENLIASMGPGGAEFFKNFANLTMSGSKMNLASKGAALSKEIEDALKRASVKGMPDTQGSLIGVPVAKVPKAPSLSSETSAAIDLIDLKYADHIQTLKDVGEADDALARRMDHLITVYGATASNVAAANLAHAKKINNDKAELAALHPLEQAYKAIYEADLKKLNATKEGTKAWVDAAHATQNAHSKLSSVRETEQGLTDDIMNQTTAINENDKKMNDALTRQKRKLQEMQNKIEAFGKAWQTAYSSFTDSRQSNIGTILDSAIEMANPGTGLSAGAKMQAKMYEDYLKYIKAINTENDRFIKEQNEIAKYAKELGPKYTEMWKAYNDGAHEAALAAAAQAKALADEQAQIEAIKNTALYKAVNTAFDTLTTGVGDYLSNALFGTRNNSQAISDITSQISALEQEKQVEDEMYNMEKFHSQQQNIQHAERLIQIDQEINKLKQQQKQEEEQQKKTSLLKKVAQSFVKSIVDDFLKQMETKTMENLFKISPDAKQLQMVKDQKNMIEGPDAGSMKDNVDSLKDTIINNSQGLYQSVNLFGQYVSQFSSSVQTAASGGSGSGNPITSTLGNSVGSGFLGNLALTGAAGAAAGAGMIDLGNGIVVPAGALNINTGGAGSASKLSYLQKAFGIASAGLAGYGIASAGGAGNSIMGGLTGGLGALAAGASPWLAAGIGFLDFLSGIGHHDNPALMPDKYDTGNWGQDNANLWGAGFNGEGIMHANGQNFTMDPTLAQATGGLGLLQYIGKWIDDNPDKAKATLGDLYNIFKGENVSKPIPGGKNGTLYLANGTHIAWQTLYSDAMQAMQDIQSVDAAAGKATNQPIVGFTGMGTSGFYPYSWDTPGYDIYNNMGNPSPPITNAAPSTTPPASSPPLTSSPNPTKGTPPGYRPPTRVGPSTQTINLYVAPEVSIDGRMMARSNQAYVLRATSQGYRYIS